MAKFYNLTIKEIKKETPNAVSIVFDIPAELSNEFKYIAGQYITIKKELAGKELRRAYSICSEPNSNELRIAVKAVENGSFSVYACNELKEGDSLDVTTPEGKFVLETSNSNSNNYLGIAAGSGITPVISMLKATLNQEPKSTFSLIYGNKSNEDTIFKNEIDELLVQFPDSLKVQYVCSREQNNSSVFGRINETILNEVLENTFNNKTFSNAFLCGPEELVNLSKNVLKNKGLNENNIHFELFTAPIADKEENTNSFNGTSEITVVVDDEETTFSMDAKTTILTAALEQGLDAPYSCQGGICSSCLCKVTEGKAVMAKNSILTDDEIEDGLVLSCQAHPTTQKITVDFDDV